MTSDILVIEKENIKDKIYYIRGQRVMIDSELAEIYGYTTKAFNQQVKNNIEKFDNDFMFQLTQEEVFELSRSKNLTSIQTKGVRGGRVYLPYAFTESGIYMLMTVLKGELAVTQSKAIIRIFREMKDYIIEQDKSNEFLLQLFIQTNENTKAIREMVSKKELIEKTSELKQEFTAQIDKFPKIENAKEMLILNGEYTKSNLTYNKIYNLATSRIYIIDDYISLKTLVLLKNISKKIKIIVFSDNVNNGLHRIEYEDFKNEYGLDITFKKTNKMFHDRYIILDYKLDTEKIFHAGGKF